MTPHAIITAARTAAAITLLALLCSAVHAPPLLAARQQGDKALCKKIQQAVRAGRSLEQIMADFQVDTRQLMKCLQKKGKSHKKKATTPAKTKPSGSTAAPQPHILKSSKLATHVAP